MKKSTLLSLATAGAIVATSAFTFAAWDQTTAEVKSNEFTLEKPVVMSMSALSVDTTRTYGETPIYSGDTNLTISNLPNGVTGDTHQINYTAVVSKAGETTKVDGVTAEAKEKTPAANLGDQHTVTVTVTPTDDAKQLALDATNLQVTVTAELVAK